MDAQPPPPGVLKRQKHQNSKSQLEGQDAACRAVSLQWEQPLCCDSLDALFGERQLPRVEELLSDGMQLFDRGQQSSQVDPTVGSAVTLALQLAVAAHDAPPDSSPTDATDYGKTDIASAVCTPAAVSAPVDPETASWLSPRACTPSHVSKTDPWAEDVFEVFKPMDWDFSQANLALNLKDMPSLQIAALLSLLRHSIFRLKNITER